MSELSTDLHARKWYIGAILGSALMLSACSGIDNSAGRATVYEDASGSSKMVSGVGIESQDIITVTDKMMRDMLRSPSLMQRTTPPRVIIDSEYFTNESSSPVNKNLLTDRLRIGLNNAAAGKLIFVGRHFSDMVEKEREMKRTGVVDGGTIRKTQATAGADYRLGGRISSLDAMDTKDHAVSRYTQITFELIDLEYGTIVWSNYYEFRKSAQDDVVYR
ncbi:penicillin-binding protein activator LpoB [Vibrio porteresiae]|uniref:Penicillin-binding protein activator LpoB n=1 Tax=Vibrio porteresiae DSM 19223 TaxID=1123496 RepID=A0ABZ0Q8T2_9VIBR|nr:penicillin-binding protein activator LpoB [Vibrio porteresiae]WPC72853.1 penicillin-binding protein activator LpoB [Vibrio porteresiae DSM 19223]